MTLEELAEKLDLFASVWGDAGGPWVDESIMFRTSAATCREALAWRKGNKHNVFPEDEVAETDRLLRECK